MGQKMPWLNAKLTHKLRITESMMDMLCFIAHATTAAVKHRVRARHGSSNSGSAGGPPLLLVRSRKAERYRKHAEKIGKAIGYDFILQVKR